MTDPENMSPKRGFPLWLLWALLAVACWGLWAVASKLIGSGLTAAQSQAVSTVGILPVLGVLTLLKPKAGELKSRKGNTIALLAGITVSLGNIAYYHALNLGGKAATVVSLTALYPLVTIILAMLLLKERLNKIQFFGIVLSLASITIFNISTVEGWNSGWLVFAMLPIILWGTGGLLQKMATNHISGERSTAWFLAAFVPVALILLLIEPIRAPVPLAYWLLGIALGFLFSLGNLALLLAFARGGKASIVAPLAGLYPIVSIPIAIGFLSEKITSREWLGIALALLAVVALGREGQKAAVASSS